MYVNDRSDSSYIASKGMKSGKTAFEKPANPSTDLSRGDLETDRSILALISHISLGVGLSLDVF